MTVPQDVSVPLLELEGVSRSFGSVQALNGVNLSIARGEVVGLLGDNGAGKSTLIKILAGVVRPDAGHLRWNGQPTVIRNAQDAMALGISVAYQDLAVVSQMSIWRNLFLGREHEISREVGPARRALRLLKANEARTISRRLLADLGIQVRDIDDEVWVLSGGERQSIAIARAVFFQSSLLILDEPTSALSVGETEKVLGYVRRARDLGVSVLLITHNVRHALAVCDSFLVLHLGEAAMRCRRGDVTLEDLNDVITTGALAPDSAARARVDPGSIAVRSQVGSAEA